MSFCPPEGAFNTIGEQMRKSPIVAMREHTRSAVQVHWKNPGEGDSAKSEIQELFPRSVSVWSEGCLLDSSFLFTSTWMGFLF